LNPDDQSIALKIPKNALSGTVNNQREQWKFKFATVLPAGTTQEVVSNSSLIPIQH